MLNRIVLLFCCLIASATTLAAEQEKLIRGNLNKVIPNVKVTTIKPSQLDGIYTVELNGSELIHVSADGRYIFTGQMHEIKNSKLVNLSDQFYAGSRKEIISQLPKNEMIIFPAKGKSAGTVYAFTDVDCGYCKKFHREVPKLSELGVEVRYLAWPRSGADETASTYRKMKRIWCSNDPQTAMTETKFSQPHTTQSEDCATPIASHFNIGRRLGIRGTPALFLEDGRQVGGYRSAEDLAQEFDLRP